VTPEVALRLSRLSLQFLQCDVAGRIFSVPPAPALLDEFLIEVRAIGQNHIAKDALVLVEAVLPIKPFLVSS
jgi:hypothetical protein